MSPENHRGRGSASRRRTDTFDNVSRLSVSTLVVSGFDSLIERVDAVCESIFTPIVRFAWTLAIGLVRGSLAIFRSPDSRMPPDPEFAELKERALVLRLAFSTYADALGSLAVLTLVATLISAPLVLLVASGAALLPTATPAGHPLTMWVATSLLEFAFYYPLLVLGVGTLALQRGRGEPIRPSRCLHTMFSKFPKLIQIQGSMIVAPLLVSSIAVTASIQVPDVWAVTILCLAALASYSWIVRNALRAPAIAFEGERSEPFDSLTTPREFVLLTSIFLAAVIMRLGLEWLIGSSYEGCSSWASACQWSQWSRYLGVRASDPLVSLAIMHVFQRKLENQSAGSPALRPEGRPRRWMARR